MSNDPFASTDRYERTPSRECQLPNCSYNEASIKRWTEGKIAQSQKSEINFWMKIGAAVLPFVVAFFTWIKSVEEESIQRDAEMKERVIQVEYQQSEITQLKNDVRELKEEVIGLRIQIERILARLEREENGIN